jgi:DNA invertase Pin-like site-specific DNA recombinase
MARKRISKSEREIEIGNQQFDGGTGDLPGNSSFGKSNISSGPNKRVAIYLRVSTGQQAEREVSVPDQRRQCRVFCTARGWEVVDEFSDAKSGRTDRRPGLRALREAALREDRPFDIVLVHSFSRLNRNEIEGELLVRELRANGVEVQSITQNVGTDPVGDFCRRIVALFDEYQAAENAKHVKRARKENARQGFWNGSRPPFGYCLAAAERRGDKIKKKLSVDQEEAAIVQKIFELYLEGDGDSGPLTVKKLTEWLNGNGFRTREGGLWGVNQVHRILTDPVHIGESVFGRNEPDPKDRIKVECPSIVSRRTFDLVARTLKSRSPKWGQCPRWWCRRPRAAPSA